MLKRYAVPWLITKAVLLAVAFRLGHRELELALIAIFVGGYIPILLYAAVPASPLLQKLHRRVVARSTWMGLLIWDAMTFGTWLLLKESWPAGWPVASGYLPAVVILFAGLISAHIAVEWHLIQQDKEEEAQLAFKHERIKSGRKAILQLRSLHSFIGELKQQDETDAAKEYSQSEVTEILNGTKYALITLRHLHYVEGMHNLDELLVVIEKIIQNGVAEEREAGIKQLTEVETVLDLTLSFLRVNGYIWQEGVRDFGMAPERTTSGA